MGTEDTPELQRHPDQRRHHHHHAHEITSLNGVYITAIVLNVLFVAIEAGVGLWSDSVGLLSDAGHNLGDVFSLLLAMLAFRLSLSRTTRKFTYGYRKSSVLISLLNSIILLVAVGAIIVESIRKFNEPVYVDGAAITWTAAAGILVNGVTALMLMKQQKHDINTKGAFLHMVTDTLVSAGVVVSGIIISLTGFTVIDPVIGLLIAVIILISTYRLLAESLRMSIDAVPGSIDPDEIMSVMSGTPGVESVHHLHIWAISTTEIAATLHLVVSGADVMERVKDEVKGMMAREGVAHCTVECELPGETCHDRDCH